MKSLVEFLRESKESENSKNFKFNLDKLKGVEDFIKSLNEAGFESVSVDENTVSVHVTLDNDSEKAFEMLQDFIEARLKDNENASNEAYAVKTHKLSDILKSWRNFVDELELGDEEGSDDNDDDDDDKKEEE